MLIFFCVLAILSAVVTNNNLHTEASVSDGAADSGFNYESHQTMDCSQQAWVLGANGSQAFSGTAKA